MTRRLSAKRYWVYVDGCFAFATDRRSDERVLALAEYINSRVAVLDSEAPLLIDVDSLTRSEVVAA